jgi:hypothetical protein
MGCTVGLHPIKARPGSALRSIFCWCFLQQSWKDTQQPNKDKVKALGSLSPSLPCFPLLPLTISLLYILNFGGKVKFNLESQGKTLKVISKPSYLREVDKGCRVTQVVACLPRKHEAMSSNPTLDCFAHLAYHFDLYLQNNNWFSTQYQYSTQDPSCRV